MSEHPHPSPSSPALRRRSVLGLVGVGTVLAGAGLVVPGSGYASAAARTPGGIAALTPPVGTPPKDLRPGGSFDRYVAQLAAADQFSGTVSLAYRNRTVLARAYGMADKQQAIPNRLDTIFALASVTKTFTALAVAQLAQQGRIAFWQTLGSYLDGFPAAIADTVTIHQLLTHTSGMGDYAQNPAYLTGLSQWHSASAMMDGLLGIIRQSPLLFTPGTAWSYSNSGYVALGAIVAKVSGSSYYDYVRDHVFAPAGMSDTGFYTQPQWLADPRIAHPYATQRSGPRVDVADRLGYIGSPAGNAFSTAADMLRFARALWSGALVDRTYTNLVTSAKIPVNLAGPSPLGQGENYYCYGLGETVLNRQRIVWHNGGGPGISTNFDTYPDLDWTAVRLSNYDTPTGIDSMERQLITTQAS